MSALTQQLAAVVERHPHAVAVADQHGERTYTQLWRDAARHALDLHDAGWSGRPVLLALPPGVAWVTALLGAWRAGAAAVPLDLSHPDHRLAQIADRCGAAGTVTADGTAPRWAGSLPSLRPEGSAREGHPPGPVPDSAIACIWHTSGSTGQPKPVALAHRALAARAATMPAVAQVTAADTIAQLTSSAFDAVLWEVLCALGTGARLQIAAQGERTPGPALTGFLARHEISAFTCTPTQLAATPYADLPALRLIVVGGEAVRTQPLTAWLERYRVANAYGPTEACIEATVALDLKPGQDPVPIGHPLPGVKAFILDADHHPVPAGHPGELHLGGDGLAEGYPGLPDATSAVFRTLDLPTGSGDALQRVYATGDLVRALPDGQLTYLGRIDQQLNLGGVRLEPGDVEAAALQLPGLRAAALLAEIRPGRRPRLVLHIEPVHAGTGDDAELRTRLRRHLAAHLAPAAVPALITVHQRLPLTATGKVDRQALAATDPAPPAPPDCAQALPEPAASWWQHWTGSAPSEDIDFFAAGGDSMGALAFLQQVNEHYGTDLPIGAFYPQPTPAFLRAYLHQQQPPEEP
ncbi:non-ribosomal peptide synthetase [Streptacidiphilus sp. N1-3]|uniref:Non-ribosomal peptide synthetase n=1 Tax=Streptacidiphilus alkalitolerans TaxID=3342712 RepID=A0ABV6XAT4_9ACTN